MNTIGCRRMIAILLYMFVGTSKTFTRCVTEDTSRAPTWDFVNSLTISSKLCIIQVHCWLFLTHWSMLQLIRSGSKRNKPTPRTLGGGRVAFSHTDSVQTLKRMG